MNQPIPFNRPPVTGGELEYLRRAVENRKLSGDGPMTKACHQWFETRFPGSKVLLTPSCTAALEMTAILADIGPGDEVIMPSFTFVSTANAFVLRGAKIVFVDVRPDTMNMDETLVEQAITSRTRAVVPVHYAGVGCHMDPITALAEKHGLTVIEDAAQGMMASYRDRPLGTIGRMGAFSFHETKNYACGEGGLLILNDPALFERAEIIREKGTDRSKFFRGEVDKYSWVDLGSSQLPSELQAAYLLAQLDHADAINRDRLATWNLYYETLRPLEEAGRVQLPQVPEGCRHNAHLFFLKCRDEEERAELIRRLKEAGIHAVFHYVPLHSSRAGERYGRFAGEDRFTTTESLRLLRLPLFYGLKREEALRVCALIREFYS